MGTNSSEDVLFQEEELICFEDGLFGFEGYRRFLPLPVVDDNDAVLSLLSVEDRSLSFIIMNPFFLVKDYNPVLSEEIYKKLKTQDDAELSYYVICVIGERPEESTVNLKCPIVVNTTTRKAYQAVLDSDQYNFRHVLKDLAGKEV